MKKLMAVIIGLFFVLAGSLPASLLAVDLDAKGSKDYRLLTRMPNFFISGYKDTEFDSHNSSTRTKSRLASKATSTTSNTA